MKYGKALQEVWEWRETVAKELMSIPLNKRARHLNKTAQEACKKLGIKCRFMTSKKLSKNTLKK